MHTQVSTPPPHAHMCARSYISSSLVVVERTHTHTVYTHSIHTIIFTLYYISGEDRESEDEPEGRRREIAEEKIRGSEHSSQGGHGLNTTRWQSGFLACTRLWVPPPEAHSRKGKIIFL